ncbi:MAG: cation diffusion facilitator family transporter [Methylococcaceae bacterium]
MAGHHHHSHAPLDGRTLQLRLGLAIALTLALVVTEITTGLMANSLALLTDALHNITDIAALLLTAFALRLEQRPAHAGKTYGYHRVGILAALINATTLSFMAFGIFHEAWQRLMIPTAVNSTLLMEVGAVAFVINLFTAWLIGHGSDDDINLHSAFLHLLGDAFSTLGAVVAGFFIRLTGYDWLDPAISLLIGLLILWNAWLIIREAIDILLESTPNDVEISTLVRDILQTDGIRGVHHLHIWSLSRKLRLLTAHIVVDDMPISQAHELRHRVQEVVQRHHGISRCTLQLEHRGCEPDSLYMDMKENPPQAHHHDHHH